MLIDWLTLKLRFDSCPSWLGWAKLQLHGDRILRICPRTGEKRWEVVAWDSIRSDSHQIAVKCDGVAVHIHGSPARVMGDGDTVFGHVQDACNLRVCAQSMIDFIALQLGLSDVPELALWRCSRIDITANYDLGSLPNVRIALAELRQLTDGRYRVSQTSGDTVYFNHKSKRKSLKIYAKGPHLAYLMTQKTYTGRSYTADEMRLADRLVRFELKLGSKFFHDVREQGLSCWDIPWSFFYDLFSEYLQAFAGDLEVDDMASMIDKLVKLPDPTGQHLTVTESQAVRVFQTFCMIKQYGLQQTREMMPKSTYYRHVRLLQDIGLSKADLGVGRILSFRRKIAMLPVESWEQLKRVA